MIVVAGHWELSWNTPIKEGELWMFPLRDFGVDRWHMWPVSGIAQREKVQLIEHPNFQSILEAEAGRTRVFVEPRNAHFKIPTVMLPEFEHPKDVMYVFGSSHFNPAQYREEGDPVVTVPTLHDAGVLWPHQCLVAVLYDRLMKQ